MSFGKLKLDEFGEVSFRLLKLGDMSFKILKLGDFIEVSFGMLKF